MSVADGMRKMLALGIPIEQALEIVEAFEIAAIDARKERNRRYYETHRPSEKRLKASESTDTPDRLKASEKRLNSDGASRVRVEDKLLPTEIEPLKVKKENKGATATPRSELEAVLDVDHAGWVIDHRQRLRKPLTVRAANQLAAKLAQCPDPNAAADLMIEKGWQSIELDWLENRTRGSPMRASEPAAGDIFAEMTRRFDDAITTDDRTEARDQQPHGDHHRYLPRSR